MPAFARNGECMRWREGLTECRQMLGIEHNTTSHTEKIISGLGGLTGILAVYWITYTAFANVEAGTTAFVLMVTSMGASAVLLFAVPHGALSQPWAVLGGHLISAFIGVTCHMLIDNVPLAGAIAVGFAIAAMHYLRCIHPPGGATALAAVIGGSDVYAAGYSFLVMPVLVNVLAILATAILFNSLFPHRRYPAHLTRRQRKTAPVEPQTRQFDLTQEDFAAAMTKLDSYMDINSEALVELLELAKQQAEQRSTHPGQIVAGHYYSNGKLGSLWAVRRASAASEHGMSNSSNIHWKTVAGTGLGEEGVHSLEIFQAWARYPVVLQNGHWVRSDDQDTDT